MRITVVQPGPAFSVEDVANGWAQAFADMGHDVHKFELGPRLDVWSQALVEVGNGEFQRLFSDEMAGDVALEGLLAHAYTGWPDLFFIVMGLFTPPRILNILKARGHKLVLCCTESPYEEDRQLELANTGVFDAVLLNDPTFLDLYRPMSPVVKYQPHCYRPDLHSPGLAVPEWVGDVCWVGTPYPSRMAFTEQIDFTGLTVRLGGNWTKLDPEDETWTDTPNRSEHPLAQYVVHDLDQCMDNDKTVQLYRSCKATWNTYRQEAEGPDRVQGWSMGPREVEATMVGTLCAREPRGEGDEILPMLPTFSSPEELGDVLRWWCAHDDERDEAVTKARAAVESRTFDNAAAELLNELEAVPAKR